MKNLLFILLNLITIFLVSSSNAFAEQLLKEISFNGFNFKLSENSQGEIKASILFESTPSKVSGFIVDNPTRIVLDVEGVPSNTARNLTLQNNKISKIRVGIHNDKTRIVLDSSILSGVTISQSGTAIAPVFTISFGNLPAEELNAEEKVNQEFTEVKPEIQGNEVRVTTTPEPSTTPSPSPSISNLATPSQQNDTPKTEKKEIQTPLPEPTPLKLPEPEVSKEFKTNIEKEVVTLEERENKVSGISEKESKVKESSSERIKTKDSSETSLESPETTPLKPEVKVERETEATTDITSPENETNEATPPESKSIKELEQSLKKEIQGESHDINGKIIIKSIVFQANSQDFVSSVVVNASGVGAYVLNEKDNSEYELILKESRLKGPHLSLPQFPPDSFKGFRYVSSSEVGSDTHIHIHVEQGIKLGAHIADGKIWVKTQ